MIDQAASLASYQGVLKERGCKVQGVFHLLHVSQTCPASDFNDGHADSITDICGSQIYLRYKYCAGIVWWLHLVQWNPS